MRLDETGEQRRAAQVNDLGCWSTMDQHRSLVPNSQDAPILHRES